MILCDLVCSLEWARKLQDLGIEQDTVFAWTCTFEYPSFRKEWKILPKRTVEQSVYKTISAFTTDELINILSRHLFAIERVPHYGDFVAYSANDFNIHVRGKKLPDVLAELVTLSFDKIKGN
jgi:hypothetical protein